MQYWREVLLFIDVIEGYDSLSVAERIYDQYPFDTEDYRIIENEHTKIATNYDSFVYLIGIEYGFIIIIATLGLIFILSTSFSERRVEIAGMRARGASIGTIFRLFVSEAISLMSLGIVVGIIAGFFSGYIFIKIIDHLTEPLVPRQFVFSSTILWMILFTIILLIIITATLSLIMSRVALNKALRSRGD
jgi:ABC-type antimicrobial peptide transport system permease subunit